MNVSVGTFNGGVQGTVYVRKPREIRESEEKNARNYDEGRIQVRF